MRYYGYFLLLIFLAACSAKPEKQAPANNTPATEQPTDAAEPREAPKVMAPSQEDEQRTEWQNPELVIQRLGNLEDKVVADLGAGSGYFSFKLSQLAERVIALDIDPRALDYIEGQMDIVGDWSKNIETRLTPADVPNLVDNEVDVVLIVNTLAFIPDRAKYLPRVLQGMRAGGKLAIVDFKTGSMPVGPSDNLKLAPRQVIKELRQAGFKRVNQDETSLQYQYIITAEK